MCCDILRYMKMFKLIKVIWPGDETTLLGGLMAKMLARKHWFFTWVHYIKLISVSPLEHVCKIDNRLILKHEST